MTKAQAQNLLDQRREGADMPRHIIDQALETTGDKPFEPVTFALAEVFAELVMERK